MSEPQVTITLGRSGQVVSRDGKRSRLDGLGKNSDELLMSVNKRPQGDGIKWNPGCGGENGSHIAQNDLRLMLLRKRHARQLRGIVGESQKTDSNKNFSRSIQAPASSHMPIHKPDSSGNNSNSLRKVQLPLPETSAKLPATMLKASIVLSPLQHVAEVRRVSSMSQGDLSRGRQLLENGSSTVVKDTPQVSNGDVKVAAESAVVQNIPNLRDESLAVAGFLHSLGLGKYALTFQAEEVGMTILKKMGDQDLKEMGILMGPRKKILLALMPRPKKPASTQGQMSARSNIRC